MRQMVKKLRVFLLLLSILIVIGGCKKKDKNPDEVINPVEDNKQDTGNEDSEPTPGEDDTNNNDQEDNTEDEKPKDDYNPSELPLVEGGIKGVYAKHNLQAGTCINGFVINNYSDHIIENYNSVTLENDMKPEAILNHDKSIKSGDIVVEYPERTIEQLEWAKKNNMKVRGHVLVWYSQTPQWIFHEKFDTSKKMVDKDTMLSRMESYLKQNFKILDELGYSDIFYAYDIVNEAIMDDGSLRDCPWKQIIGDDYIWHAFNYAKKYAPKHIKLYYNDYNEQFKTDAVVKLAKSLVDDKGNSLIDGIGCQAHLYTEDSIDKYMKTLEAFSATGLDVQITEIDVSLGTWQNILQPTEENLKKQGQYYYKLVSSIIEANKAGTTNVSGITFWGISDGASWRRDRSPLLFDEDLKPKYAYFGAVLDYDHSGH
ncbi:endo-1,4-beta-xylanase [Herbinix luporum]|jgi:endo-1,4-beta-xylanase|uniref:Beta-xylanase n=1 Tax=Herbinix luporum TaxID=1679721 RepID=A0A0K8J5V7_9FIRM|nr:endo-1,4-beta-xylanase [Herbinix luporum]MDI9488484.1 endo-1,4-beta-xylanase [Bacillota bacterium]CUH92739.1 putative secreted protein [Herbinix luporum]HHT57905.1 endo-1,4-beta-xylanase [Herbinix luporum]